MNALAKKKQYLEDCRKDLEQAQQSGSPKEISQALANYGYALSINQERDQAMEYFDRAEKLAGTEVEDLSVLGHIYGLRSLVYQEGKRLPDAYQTSTKMLLVAQEENHVPIEIDAVANQAQILLDSGEVEGSFRKFREAENLAKAIGDQHRLMRIKGALANLSLAIPSLEQAADYYQQALELARETDDQEAEVGFLGNLGSVFAWQGNHREAVQAFEEILPAYQETGDKEKLVQLLGKLVRSCSSLEEDQKVLGYAFQGIDLLEDQQDAAIFDFLEAVILAYFRQEKIPEAQNMIADAITIARSAEDKEREVEFLINLGESFLASEMLDRALETYRKALEEAQELDQVHFQAYLNGRLGYTLAELGNLQDAVAYHQQSIQMAEQDQLSELAGNQHSMLAVTYRELGQMERAVSHGEQALEIYQQIGQEAEARKVRELLETIRDAS
jgi:tetratricopeptide (TPR) repeat protein